MKRCKSCRTLKPLEEFQGDGRTRDGRATNCRQCGKSRAPERQSARHYKLVTRYGISAEEEQELIAAQGGLCASCREEPATQVDHDHKTGKVRGVLCDGCNGGIALFDEDIDLLRRAFLYLNGEFEA